MKLLPIQSSYNGKSGFYCSMYPTSKTLQTLVSLYSEVEELIGRLVPPALMHVTVMYSEDSIPMSELPWIDRDLEIPVTAVGYDFMGPQDKTTGAVALLLDSKSLEDYHQGFRDIVRYTWDEFRPHLTLAYDVSPVEAALIIGSLKALPLPQNLVMTAPVFEDAK